MKNQLLIFAFLASAFPLVSQASGCSSQNWLHKEVSVLELGSFIASYKCVQVCGIWVKKELDDNSGLYESHFLHQQDRIHPLPPDQAQGLKFAEVKIYRQHLSDGCDDTFRYVLGYDYNGLRYREVMDD
jgi:hypothetical protein